MNDTVDEFRDWDAAYVLGALSPDDRRAFELHLASCDACATAVAELAGLPGILGKLDVDSALALEGALELDAPSADHLRDQDHAPGLVQRLARTQIRRQRRVRVGWLAGALALVVALVTGGVTIASLNSSPPVETVAMTAVAPYTMSAKLTVTSKGWGTRLDWNCQYESAGVAGRPSGGRSYDLVVRDAAGHETTVATWTALGSRAGDLAASTSIETSDIRSVFIRPTGSSTVLAQATL
ncbi:MAG: hypothetical protein QOI02_1039 [Actinomycetota bacterium]|nr:hypothetical protein [Actinomycetota bacterium]